jgi:nucleoside recognition membrane protein YjiH
MQIWTFILLFIIGILLATWFILMHRKESEYDSLEYDWRGVMDHNNDSLYKRHTKG